MPRRPLIPLPYPHFMAFAPLDAWARVLVGSRVARSPRYWPRLAFALFCSALATAGTLPERLALAPILRIARRRAHGRLAHGPGVIVVLGYFRSGTTHLHYLLSCDPRTRTPTWAQALCPQGWWASWTFLRVFMIPFVSATRPQDDVAIGPDWPAEDDFACNNWTATSSLPSRFVVPSRHGHFRRFHDLEGLSPAERERYRFTQWAFLRKLAWLSPRRAILLKSPSHTARVAELAWMMPGARFVHISRDPAAVIQSNITMAQRLGVFNLEDPPTDADTRGRVVEEYLASEERYLRESAALPAGSAVEVRYEDLVADPMGTLRRIYSALGLPWPNELERRALTYLASVKGYRAANKRDDQAAKVRAGETAGERAEAAGARRTPAPPSETPSHASSDEAVRIAALVSRFGHDRPPVPTVEPPAVDLGGSARRRRLAAAAVAVGALAIGALWLAQAWVMRDRNDWLAWPAGVALGFLAIRVARVGSGALGLWTAAAVAITYAATVVPGTFLADYGQRGAEFASPERPSGYLAGPGEPRAFWGLSPWVTTDRWEWDHILLAARRGGTAQNNLFWLFMGVVTAYRFASRRHVTPPGR